MASTKKLKVGDEVEALIAAWESVSPREQVPEEINVDRLWEDAHAAIAKATR